jgi:glycosyltransferase involved in cell wall biosynthesis
MDICFFGTYAKSEGYPVNLVLLKGLSESGSQVEECHEELWEGFLHTMFARLGLWGLMRLAKRLAGCYWRLAKRYRRSREHQCVVVGYPGYLDVWLARLLNWRRRRLVVLVAFISLYDTAVNDRGKVKEGSVKGRLLRLLDRWAFMRADLVLVDTAAHAAHYASMLDLPLDKFVRSYVGQDEEDFRPRKMAGDKPVFDVLFFGTYVPLHGIDVIIDAAALLRDEAGIEVTLVGKGQLYDQMRRRAEAKSSDGLALGNLHFVDRWLDAEELAQRIGVADVCLGIFGTTGKAARVIPYKVFGALAMQKPLLTRDSPAIRELLQDGRDALLCAPGSASELAAGILRLRHEPGLATRLAEAGHRRYLESATPRAIGDELRRNIEVRLAG